MSLHILHNSHCLSSVQRLHNNINILSQNNLTDGCLIVIMSDTGHDMITEHELRCYEVMIAGDMIIIMIASVVLQSERDNHNFHSC